MKKLGVVLQYELMTYIKNKSYVISTVVIAVIAAAIMFVPRAALRRRGILPLLIKIIKQTIIKM